ncbi:MAG TPA: asparagine synthase (glutamine-hydrolyzing) [Vicinamibacterales bacterium]|nr:asparagine synthase (glutamine-hydrolyzing) [Vicinamibacterales bacterium]
MCGIAGLVACDQLLQAEAALVESMRDVLAHRGPDDAGAFVDEHAALGHRRLSIVDLAAGHQPMANEDRTVWIVFNGEIYDHADTRRELESRGHRYRTRSDTETIVHAYEQWGDACVERLRGMFAFAIWDAPKRRLLLARDRLGVKPLYWTLAGGRLIFGSEIKALLASGLVAPQANEAAIPELLSTRYLSGSDTLFRGISRLLPGHTLVFERGTVTVRRYWDVPVGAAEGRSAVRSDAEAVAAFRRLLEESVRIRLMSDVPLGMFLSGGLDSSAIAAIMARQIDRPLQTFSVAFEERAFSELEYARDVARAIGAESHEVVLGREAFFDAWPRLVWHEDEPIAHPSSVPLYFVSELARRHVTVVLTGEGSDELLAGYGKYPRALINWRAASAYGVLPGPLRRWIDRRVVPHVPGQPGRYARRSFLRVPRTPEAMFFDNFAAIGLERQRRLLSPRLAVAATPDRAYAASCAYFDAPDRRSTVLDRLLYADLKTYLVELLMKQDQMSMAASIESRVPFLDHRLVEFVAQLPDRLKLRGRTTKWILREAARDLLPASILSRRKMGFPVPFAHWMKGDASPARDVLLDRCSRERGLTDPAAVARLIDDHERGTAEGGDALWALMNLELWYRTFIDGGGVQSLPAPGRPRPQLKATA